MASEGTASATPAASGAVPGSAPILPADNFRKADIPASNGTTTDPNLATVHRPEGETVNVTQFTVHNWVEAVYKAFKIEFPTGVWQISSLGVREASMLAKGVQTEDAVVRSEELAGQGKTSATGSKDEAKMDRTTREQNVLKGKNTKFDDVLYIVWTESTVDKDQKVEVFQCTIDPGTDVSGTGYPFLLEGFEYVLSPIKHKLSKVYKNPANAKQTGNTINAFRVNDKGKAVTSVVRTAGKRVIKADKDISGKSLVKSNSDPGINIHFRGYNNEQAGEDFGGWSAGCTVLRHPLFSKRYGRFIDIIHKSKKPRPYLIVSSQYLRLYHEWVDYCKGDKTKAQDPKSVLKEDALKERELNGKYIPSIIDVTYAKANPARVTPALFTTAK
jgi:hypothetical protein